MVRDPEVRYRVPFRLNSLGVSLIVLCCTSAAALLGVMLRKALPESHLDSDSKDVLKLVMGLIATISALVLSLLIASANSSFNAQQTDVQNFSVNVVQLDRILALYGPEAQLARALLRQTVTLADRRMINHGVLTIPQDLQARANQFAGALRALNPQNDIQRLARNQAFDVGLSLVRTRLLIADDVSGSISWPFLAVLTGWISMLFLGFGLLTRFHATSAAALLAGALSVSAAIFLILELNQPYGGLIQMSDLPLRHALAVIGGPSF